MSPFSIFVSQNFSMEKINDQFLIGEVPVLDLCSKYETPLYVYETASIERQYKRLLKAFAGIDLKIKYACKALTNINILRFFHSLGSGLDTVSIQEVWLGLRAGFDPKDIIYTPNCVSLEEIGLAVDSGVKINIDNISILEQFGHMYGDSVPVCLRFNPHILAGGNAKISTGHIDSKFGISIHQLRHVERVIASEKIRVEGLHMHTGSDILDVEVFLRGADILLDVAKNFKHLLYIDFGSGFKVAYKPNDNTTDVEGLGQQMGERFRQFCGEYGRDLVLNFEPGKFLVSEAGYFLAKVNVVKHTTATVFAGVDSGMNHLIRPMLYDAYHHIINISNPNGNPRIYTVVGYICETDTFGWDRKIPEIREGDVLCFLNAGAYGSAMASNYNSRFRPAEVLIHQGKDYLIRRRENLDDLLRGQIEELQF
jgi:diaminopimelate decarboxylase